ncbi:MAG TPA: TonB-dependent receptor, partial [Opitutaceae bacterium]
MHIHDTRLSYMNKMNTRRLRQPWSAALAPVLLAPLLAAQPATEAEERTTLDAVVVTGQALAIQRSAEAKERAPIILDALSADDIGKLPDHNTAAALRRLPGVSVQEDQGESRWPVIRGLNSSYNSTTVNGATVASPDYQGRRDVPLDVIPAALAKRIEVRKTVTPDMDHNSLGGSIDIITHSAFDFRRPFLLATGAWADYAEKGHVRPDHPSGRGNVVAGTTFGANHEFGVIVSGNYQRRDSDIPQVEIAGNNYQEYDDSGAPVPLGTGNGYLVPVQRRLFWYHNIRERLGGSATFEWRPRDGVRGEFGAHYNQIQDDERRDENRLEPVGNVSGQTATTGSFAQGRNVIGLGRFQIDRATWGTTAKFDWALAPDWRWLTRFSWSAAEADNPESTEEFRTDNTYGLTYRYDDFFPQFVANDTAGIANSSNYAFQNRSTLVRHSEEEVLDLRSDLEHDSTLVGRPVTYKAGFALRRTERDFDQDSTSFAYAGGTPYTLAQATQAGPDYTFQGGYRMGPLIDSGAALAFFDDNRGAFTGTANNILPDYAVTEDVYAGYAMATLTVDRITLIGGARFERTEVGADFHRSSGNSITAAESSGSNDQFLPGLNASLRMTERFVLRGAVTRTFGRPNFASLAGREQVSFTSSIPTVSRGNPGLKPREATNYDLSLEYYLKHGVVSVAAFAKEVKNE